MSRPPKFSRHFCETDFRDAARYASDNRECIRLLGLAFLQQTCSAKETAKAFNVTEDAVHKWKYRFKQGGLDGLKDQGGRGRKKRLSEEDETTFKDAVLEMQKQKAGGSITGHDVGRLLKEKFGVDCKKTAVYRLLHRVGLSWISGRSRHPKQDKAAQNAFKKTSVSS